MTIELQKTTKPSFEECLSGVETIVERLEGGNLSLEKALALFTEGVGLVRQCQEHLQKAERQVQLLVGDSQLFKTEPFPEGL